MAHRRKRTERPRPIGDEEAVLLHLQNLSLYEAKPLAGDVNLEPRYLTEDEINDRAYRQVIRNAPRPAPSGRGVGVTMREKGEGE